MNDDEDEDEYFEAIREAGTLAPRSRPRLSEPITRDQTVEQLHHVHQMVLDDFVEEGKVEGQRIMNLKNLKTVPFTETMLRQMAMTFPTTEAEMRQIPGIDQLKVDNFSQPFLKLTKKWKQTLREMMHGGANPNRPFDPNHQIVDLVSDDDGGDTYGSELDLSEEEQSSKFFGQQSRAAANFNRQMEEATQSRMTQAAKTRKRPAADGDRAGPSRKRSSGGGATSKKKFHKQYAYKENKAGPSTSRAGAGGAVAKRKSSSTYGANTGRAKSRGPAAGGGTQRTFMAGGIGMMPT